MPDPSGEAARRLLTVTFDTADPGSASARWAVESYFDELDERFPGGFDRGLGGAAADLEAFQPPTGAFVLVNSVETAIGCGAVQRIDGETAEIKRMWIDADWRGIGLGRRLLAHLEQVAGDLGYIRVVLDTNDTLTEAINTYLRAGYTPIERYNDNPYAQRWFAKDLTS